MTHAPIPIDTLLFAQHGWADTNQSMQRFGETVASPGSLVIAPNLGYIRSWLRIEPLIEIAEHAAARAMAEYPHARIRAIGHSMGGLIWIELLTRHPDWLERVDRLALIGCPVGGAELAGLLDPLGLTIGRDLKVDRRPKAEEIAKVVPTLTIVGDLFGPHDGTVTHESARLENARFVLTPAASHASLRNSPVVTRLVRAFFEQPTPPSTDVDALVARIQAVPGIRPADARLLRLASVSLMLADGSTVRTLNVIPGIELVFVTDGEGRCAYAGAVPWSSRPALRQVLDEAREHLRSAILDL
ncbi:MAG TPA: lysophospholipase [Chloroflexota bacterium]|nr:lysophospholipase [Chloroflexota bacterium]